MKMVWKKNDKKRAAHIKPTPANLPFDQADEGGNSAPPSSSQAGAQSRIPKSEPDESRLAESFESEGNKLAENGRYHEALTKWEAALTLMPERAILHEQKAQVLLEIGAAWKALKAARTKTASTAMDMQVHLENVHQWRTSVKTKSLILMDKQLVFLGCSTEPRSLSHYGQRAQLNFGEPEASIESFDKALSIKPDLGEAQSDRQTALHLVKKRERLQIAGSDVVGHRYIVKDKNEN